MPLTAKVEVGSIWKDRRTGRLYKVGRFRNDGGTQIHMLWSEFGDIEVSADFVRERFDLVSIARSN